jgi:hypothetical protein
VLPSDIWEDAAHLGRAILLDAIRLAARGTPSSPVAEAGLFFNLEKDMTNRCVAALGVALAFGATAASSAEKHRDLHIVIETIDHSKQRYPTVGDWQIDKAGNLHITVSKMSDQRYEFLIGMHEAIEAYLAIHAGVSPEAVDKFDRAYEAKRKPGDDSEPGDDPRAPYHREHVFATKVERLLAHELGVDWSAYGREVSSK